MYDINIILSIGMLSHEILRVYFQNLDAYKYAMDDLTNYRLAIELVRKQNKGNEWVPLCSINDCKKLYQVEPEELDNIKTAINKIFNNASSRNFVNSVIYITSEDLSRGYVDIDLKTYLAPMAKITNQTELKDPLIDGSPADRYNTLDFYGRRKIRGKMIPIKAIIKLINDQTQDERVLAISENKIGISPEFPHIKVGHDGIKRHDTSSSKMSYDSNSHELSGFIARNY